jgi:hypothetical protein
MQASLPLCQCCETGSLLILGVDVKRFYRFFEAASQTSLSAAAGLPYWRLT